MAPKHFSVTVQFCCWWAYNALSSKYFSICGPAPTKTSRCFDVWNNVIVGQYLSGALVGPMQPYLPNGFLIWVDGCNIGSFASIVMHLTRNKAEINFPWFLCGAFFNDRVFVPEGALTPLLLTSLSFIPWAYQSHWNDNCFSICGHKTSRQTFFQTPMSLKALNHSYKRNESDSYQYGSSSSNGQKSYVTFPLVGHHVFPGYWFTKLYSTLHTYALITVHIYVPEA